MHVIVIPQPLDKGPLGIFPPGEYVMEDANCAELILQHPDIQFGLSPWVAHPNNDKEIIVAGGLGMGDAIMLTPTLRTLKEQNPDHVITVACMSHFRAPLLNLPYIDGFGEWPMRNRSLPQVYFLEGFMRRPEARTLHMTDVFAGICGVTLTDKKPDYRMTDDEATWAREAFPRIPGRRRLGLQVQASHRCRTYPQNQLLDVVNLLVKDGWEIYLLGAPHEFGCVEMGHLHDARIKAPRFREMAAFLTTCDAFCGPDSAFLHVAGALNIPAVGLFGVFPWRLRTAYYSSVFAIQGAGECSPCFHTPSKLQPAFPRTGPCFKSGRCEVLADIQPERIRAKICEVAG